MRYLLVLLFGGVFFVAGCGSGEPRLAKVSGRITIAGKPLTNGIITFHNENGERPASGQIQPDGSYTLTTLKTGDGALVGEHVITISAFKVGPNTKRPATPEEEQEFRSKPGYVDKGPIMIGVPGKVDAQLPAIYANAKTSPLRKTVEDKTNEINFDIE